MGNVVDGESALLGVVGAGSEQSESGVEYTAEFQEIDAAINAFDSEGLGPLRKGERPFQWDGIVRGAENLLAQSPDLRVAVWLLRALLAQQGVVGLIDGLTRIGGLLALPHGSLFPRAMDGEESSEVHAISLAWLGSAALLHQVRTARIAPNIALVCADLHQDITLAQTLDASTQASMATAMQSGMQALNGIVHLLQKDGLDISFNVAPLHGELEFMCKALLQHTGAATTPISSASAPVGTLHDVSKDLGMRTRAEVQQTLSGLIAYFKEHEPGHPAPLLLQRVQRMLGASFEELLSELYADAQQMIARIEKPQAL